MGGNALSVKSVRLNSENYESMAKKCVSILGDMYPSGRACAIASYASKPDHGDLDLLVAADAYEPAIAAKGLGAVEVVRNGPVTSIGVLVDAGKGLVDGNVFQVDLISIGADSFDYAAAYFSFNDLGNLIGRTAHAAGVAHRHDGLWFYVRDGDYKFREILLTKDYGKALGFLGYSKDRFDVGFEDLEDIFWYVALSKYFNRDIFLLENRNAQSRIRDRKRKTYMQFLEFCEARPDLPAFVYPKEKRDWMPSLYGYFEGFEDAHKQALSDLQRQRDIKAKFNGEWVSSVTGLQGKELGNFMRRFKESFTDQEAMKAFVLENSQEEIYSRVMGMVANV